MIYFFQEARTNEEIKKWFIQLAVKCSKDPFAGGEFPQMKNNRKIPESTKAKCIAACIFKTIEWLDDKGMFDAEKAYKLAAKDYANDQVKLGKAKELYELCRKVNTQTIGDGELGCERSNLLAMCLSENGPKVNNKFH
ncbi:unnamed protein product, partial [Brenthis ino]